MFLSWLEQYYDLFIDLSPRRYSPFQFAQFCDLAYHFNTTSNAIASDENGENALLFVFSLPSTIDGLRRLSVKMSVSDLERILLATRRKEEEEGGHVVLNVVKAQLQRVFSVDSDLCILEEIGSNTLVLTRDGRVKVITGEGHHP